jgi:hypothetical protein
MVPLYPHPNPFAVAVSSKVKPKLKRSAGAAGAAIDGGNDLKFAEEFAQALSWRRFDRGDM